MRLTKREKLMVLVLLFCVLGYFLFKYVVTPQLSEITSLKADYAEWQDKKQALSAIDDKIAKLNGQKTDLESKIQAVGNGYFTSLGEQEESIIVLNELLLDTGLKDVSISFDTLTSYTQQGQSKAGSKTPAPKATESGAPIVQNAKLSYEGSYDSVWSALRAIWNCKKLIQVNAVHMKEDPTKTGILTGDIELSLIDLSGMTQVSGTMVEWSESGTFRKADPFEKNIAAVFPGSRYKLNLDYQTSKYVKFVDITGHWAEAAIDDFGSRHLITGDGANRFYPDQPITRGEFVMLLDQFYKWEAPENSVDLTKFSDYSELGQSLSSMEKAFYKGYMMGFFVGYGDGTLRPNAPTSYSEFELVMSRIMEQPDFKWKNAALTIEKDTGYKSPGIDDDAASMTKAEAVYFMHSLPQP